MSKKMKCPFCGGELYGCIGHPYCRNEKCEMCDEIMPQELLDLLDSTRKDLEIARKALEYYADSRFGKKQDDGTYVLEIDKGCGVTVVYTYDPRPAKKALEQITHDNSEKPNSVEHKE